jgi:hypothetical protein
MSPICTALIIHVTPRASLKSHRIKKKAAGSALNTAREPITNGKTPEKGERVIF